jgi:hypothetical protein
MGMRFEFLLVPAALVAATAAHAESYLTVEEAQKLIFPGATFTPADFTLAPGQVEELIRVSQTTVFHSKVKAWRVSTGGWFFIDQVIGRDDRVTYALGVDEQGAVKGVEVLVCVPGYDKVREPRWLDQFHGKRYGDAGDLTGQVSIISGTTLTSEHITEGVKRILATFGLFMAPGAGKPG